MYKWAVESLSVMPGELRQLVWPLGFRQHRIRRMPPQETCKLLRSRNWRQSFAFPNVWLELVERQRRRIRLAAIKRDFQLNRLAFQEIGVSHFNGDCCDLNDWASEFKSARFDIDESDDLAACSIGQRHS